MAETDKTPNKASQVQGEGNYEAGRRFQEAERSFVEKGPVEEKAQEAEQALEGPEGAELERARRETAKGRPGGTSVANEDEQAPQGR